jgi:Tol biopolymer transport system component
VRRKSFVPAVLATAAGVLFLADAQQPAQQTKAPAAAKGAIQGRLSWLDRQGKVVGTVGEPGLYRTLSLSRDGKRLAVERTDPQTQNRDIWLVDLERGGMTRFTSDPAWEAFPVWSPDGSRVVFTSNRSGVFDIYQKPSNGSADEELLDKSGEGRGPTSWSPDGRFLAYYSIGQPTRAGLLPLLGERRGIPLLDAQFSSVTARFSPDGRWIVYTSNESGRNEVSVRPFDSVAGSPVVVTNGGGRTPLWRGDGKEIFYMSQDGMAMAVEVNTAAGFQAGTPKSLFPAPAGLLFWDVAPDGARFLLPVPDSGGPQ